MFNINIRVSSYSDLSTVRQHVNSLVIIYAHNCSVRTRSTSEFVNLIAQRRNVFASLSQGVRKFFILTGEPSDLQFQVDRRGHTRSVFVRVRCHVSPQAIEYRVNRLTLYSASYRIGQS